MSSDRGYLAEQLLVVRSQVGDREAFAQLIDQYHARVRYYAARLMDHAQDVEDVIQESWLAAYEGIRRLQSPAAFRVWLYRIVRDKAISRLRRRRQWAEIPEEADMEAPAEGDSFTAEDAARIHAALERLTPAHREALVLRFLEGMSYKEMASVTGCQMGTIRSRLHNAKRAIENELERTS